MESILIPHTFLLLACVALAYVIVGAYYRLYLSPIARYPGPKLAALTFWYEFYYDVLCHGRYTWKIGELHRQYGTFSNHQRIALHNTKQDHVLGLILKNSM